VGFSSCTSCSLPSSDIASICFKFSRYFICMLQMFHVDVVKVDWDVAMTIHVCCKRLFQMFQLFQTDVAHVLFGCCIRLTLMLQLLHPDVTCFHTYVASVFIWMLHMFCNGYTRVSLMFQTYVASISTISDVCCKYFL
jgi:hypothetical protein